MLTLRILFLVVNLFALGVGWVLHSHADWIYGLDQYLCTKYVQASDNLWVEVQAVQAEQEEAGYAPNPELQRRVIGLLESTETMQFGDRKFARWKSLLEWLVLDLGRAGDWERANAWQARLMEITPNDMQQALIWVHTLNAHGGARELEQAVEILDGMRAKLPDWAPAITSALQQSARRQDWGGMTADLGHWMHAKSRPLTKSWRLFFKMSPKGLWSKSPLHDAFLVEGTHTFRLQVPVPQGSAVEALRVDPPGRCTGVLRGLKIYGVQGNGQRIGLEVLKAFDGLWRPEGELLELSDGGGPRLTLRSPGVPLRAIHIEFEALVALPDWVMTLVFKHPELLERLRGQGFLEGTQVAPKETSTRTHD